MTQATAGETKSVRRIRGAVFALLLLWFGGWGIGCLAVTAYAVIEDQFRLMEPIMAVWWPAGAVLSTCALVGLVQNRRWTRLPVAAQSLFLLLVSEWPSKVVAILVLVHLVRHWGDYGAVTRWEVKRTPPPKSFREVLGTPEDLHRADPARKE